MFYYYLRTDFAHCFGVSIVEIEQVNFDWVTTLGRKVFNEVLYEYSPDIVYYLNSFLYETVAIKFKMFPSS